MLSTRGLWLSWGRGGVPSNHMMALWGAGMRLTVDLLKEAGPQR